jgi:hypothetical protein
MISVKPPAGSTGRGRRCRGRDRLRGSCTAVRECTGLSTSPPMADSTASTTSGTVIDGGGLVGVDVGAVAGLAEEGQHQEAHHVEGGQAGGDEAEQPDPGKAVREQEGLVEDLVLGDERRERRHAGDRDRADQHRRPGDRHLLAQAAHHPMSCWWWHGVDHRAGAEEEQGLEEGVREEVEDAGGTPPPRPGEHVAELADRRVRQDLLDVGLAEGEVAANRAVPMPTRRRSTIAVGLRTEQEAEARPSGRRRR